MENAGYVFSGYAIIWLVLFGYVLVLFNRQKKLQREIEALKDSLKEKQGN